MTRTWIGLALGSLMLVVLPRPAAAQTSPPPQGFVDFYLGYQGGSFDFTDVFSFGVYDEQATVTTAQTYDGGGLFALGGAARLRGPWYAGAQFTHVADHGAGTANASIPHPTVFNRPRTASITADDYKHSENALHVFAGYMIPAGERVDVMVSAGPTFFGVHQELIRNVTFKEGAFPYDTVTLTGTEREEVDDSAVALNFGVDVMVHTAEHISVGGYFRFAKSSVEVPGAAANATIKLDVGGPQFGAGIRVAF